MPGLELETDFSMLFYPSFLVNWFEFKLFLYYSSFDKLNCSYDLKSSDIFKGRKKIIAIMSKEELFLPRAFKDKKVFSGAFSVPLKTPYMGGLSVHIV